VKRECSRKTVPQDRIFRHVRKHVAAGRVVMFDMQIVQFLDNFFHLMMADIDHRNDQVP
jgi:hypothetical protein